MRSESGCPGTQMLVGGVHHTQHGQQGGLPQVSTLPARPVLLPALRVSQDSRKSEIQHWAPGV